MSKATPIVSTPKKTNDEIIKFSLLEDEVLKSIGNDQKNVKINVNSNSPTNKSDRGFFKHFNSIKGKKVWNAWMVLLVELIGTILLVSMIFLPNVLSIDAAIYNYEFHNPAGVGTGTSDSWVNSSNYDFALKMQNFFSYAIFGAIYVGVGIFILVIVFIWVSANFNPVVTIVEMSKGHDSYRLGFSKIVIQFAAAFIGTMLMVWLSQNVLNTYYLTMDANAIVANGLNNYIPPTSSGVDIASVVYSVNYDSVYPVIKVSSHWTDVFNAPAYQQSMTAATDSWFWFVSIAIEALLVFILLGSVFWFKTSKVFRSVIVTVLVTLAVYIGTFTLNIALNPARLIAPAVVNDVVRSMDGMTASTGMTQWLWIYLVGQILGAYLFVAFGNKRKTQEKELVENFAFNTPSKSKSIEASLSRSNDFDDVAKVSELKNFALKKSTLEKQIFKLKKELEMSKVNVEAAKKLSKGYVPANIALELEFLIAKLELINIYKQNKIDDVNEIKLREIAYSLKIDNSKTLSLEQLKSNLYDLNNLFIEQAEINLGTFKNQ